MTLSNWINFLLLVVSVIAAGIAWRAVFAARASAREANRIQQRLLEIETAREEREVLAGKQADFEVEISFGENYSYTFYCTNRGNGTAKQFKVLWNGHRLQDMKGALLRVPIIPDEVKPEETVRLEMERAFEQAKLLLEWRDESGAQRTFPFTRYTALKRIS